MSVILFYLAFTIQGWSVKSKVLILTIEANVKNALDLHLQIARFPKQLTFLKASEEGNLSI